MRNNMRKNTKLITALLLAAVCLLANPALVFSQSKSERDSVQTMLLAYDTFPSAADFKKVAKDPRAQLLAIYRSSQSTKIVRLQALDALSLFPNAEVRALYRELLSKDWGKKAPAAAHRAINGLMHGFGEAAVEDITPLLSHQDVQIRLTVVHALAKSGGESGRQILLDHFDSEVDKVVRETITRQTTRLQ